MPNAPTSSAGKPAVSILLRLLVATALLAATGRASLRAAETNPAVKTSAADWAWQALQHACATPPEPLKQLPNRMYTQQEIRAYYTRLADRAGDIADAAKRFYLQYPDHPKAARARDLYFDMLHAAVTLSSTRKVAELEAATAERLKDPKLDEAGRFQLSLRLLRSAVSGRQYESDDAMRAELEKRARQLARDYPNHLDGYRYLLNLARVAAPEKSVALAQEILAGCHDADMRNECQGLIRRSAALGKPLALSLSLDNGQTVAVDKEPGRVLLLLFWDSASRFSPKALWAVNQLYLKYHARGLDVIGLNFDIDDVKAAAALKDAGVTWPQYRDARAGWKMRDRFGAEELPMCWFVDKKGVLRDLHGERDPIGIVQQLLAE